MTDVLSNSEEGVLILTVVVLVPDWISWLDEIDGYTLGDDVVEMTFTVVIKSGFDVVVMSDCVLIVALGTDVMRLVCFTVLEPVFQSEDIYVSPVIALSLVRIGS